MVAGRSRYFSVRLTTSALAAFFTGSIPFFALAFDSGRLRQFALVRASLRASMALTL
jgi:hypothetical protein